MLDDDAVGLRLLTFYYLDSLFGCLVTDATAHKVANRHFLVSLSAHGVFIQ